MKNTEQKPPSDFEVMADFNRLYSAYLEARKETVEIRCRPFRSEPVGKSNGPSLPSDVAEIPPFALQLLPGP